MLIITEGDNNNGNNNNGETLIQEYLPNEEAPEVASEEQRGMRDLVVAHGYDSRVSNEPYPKKLG